MASITPAYPALPNDTTALATAEQRLASEARLLVGNPNLTADAAISEALAEVFRALRENRIASQGGFIVDYGAAIQFNANYEVREAVAIDGSGQTELALASRSLSLKNAPLASTASGALLGYLPVYLAGTLNTTGKIPVYGF